MYRGLLFTSYKIYPSAGRWQQELFRVKQWVPSPPFVSKEAKHDRRPRKDDPAGGSIPAERITGRLAVLFQRRQQHSVQVAAEVALQIKH